MKNDINSEASSQQRLSQFNEEWLVKSEKYIYNPHLPGRDTKIYTGTQINSKTSNLDLKWAEELNRHFSKEGIKIAKRNMKKSSINQFMGTCKGTA